MILISEATTEATTEQTTELTTGMRLILYKFLMETLICSVPHILLPQISLYKISQNSMSVNFLFVIAEVTTEQTTELTTGNNSFFILAFHFQQIWKYMSLKYLLQMSYQIKLQ